MTAYRMYSLDGHGRIGFADEIEAKTDGEAVDHLREIKPNAIKCELWEGRRLVGTLRGPDWLPEPN